MSTSSSAAAAAMAAALGSPPTDKLTRKKHLFWKMQVLPALRGAQVMGLLDGSDFATAETVEDEDDEHKKKMVPNPAYGVWLARDQQVLSYLVKSLSPEVMSQVVGAEHTVDLWAALNNMFASTSTSRITMLRGALSNTKKLDMSADKYLAKMKAFASELAAAGRKVDDLELKEYILNGLDADYTPLVASINAVPSTTLTDQCSQLTSYDQRQRLLSENGQNNTVFQSSANAATRGNQSKKNSHGGPDNYRGNRGRNDQRHDSWRGGENWRGGDNRGNQGGYRDYRGDNCGRND